MLYKQYGIEKFPGQFSQKFTKNLPLPSFLKQFNSNFKEMCFSILQTMCEKRNFEKSFKKFSCLFFIK